MINAMQWGYSSAQIWSRLPHGRLIEGDGGYAMPTGNRGGGMEPGRPSPKRNETRWRWILHMAIVRDGVATRDLIEDLEMKSGDASAILYSIAGAGLLRKTGDMRRRASWPKGCLLFVITDAGRNYIDAEKNDE